MHQGQTGHRTLVMSIVIAGGMIGLLALPPVSMAAGAASGQAAGTTADQIKGKVSEALKHAKEAENAGQQGKADALVKHAEIGHEQGKRRPEKPGTMSALMKACTRWGKPSSTDKKGRQKMQAST